MLVRVTNKNNTGKLIDKFGGQKYEFPPGESVNIPEETATHIFGWGLSEKEQWKKFLRAGLANAKNGEKIWKNFVLRPASNVEPTGVSRDV